MLARTLAGALGFGLTVNALIMFVDPTLWYHRPPGVPSPLRRTRRGVPRAT